MPKPNRRADGGPRGEKGPIRGETPIPVVPPGETPIPKLPPPPKKKK
jgi:hypothetical protein